MITAIPRVLRPLVAIPVALLAVSSLAAQQITQVTPDGSGVSVPANQSGNQVTFTVQSQSQTSSTRNLYLTCSGPVSCSPVPSYVTFTYSTTVTVTFSSLAPGLATITLLATGSTSSNQGFFNVTVTQPWGVAVTPDGGNEPTRTANTGGYGASFTVKNTGTNANTFSFSCAGSGGVTCGTVPGSVSPAPNGGQVTVTMPYSVGAAGSGTLTLTATGTSASDAGSYSVPIVSYGVSVTPDGGGAPTRTANTGGYSQLFTVVNTGSVNNTFSFTCSGAGGVTCGTVPAPVSVGAGLQTTVSMPYSVGAPGTGTLTLTASGTNASDGGSYSVPIVSYGVSVTPDGGTAPTRAANTGGYSETFTVTNTGSASNTFTFFCGGAGGVTCGTVPAAVTVGAGLQTSVSMPYSVGAPGTGGLALTATGTNASDGGNYSVPIVSFSVSVTPDGATAATRAANTGGYSESFTVTNSGSASNTFSFTCNGLRVTCGTVPAPVTLGPGLQTTVTMPYSAGAAGTGELTLTASGTNAINDGSYLVPIVAYGVSVTPDGGTTPIRTPNTGGYSGSFTVQNTGATSNTFSFTCSGLGGATCGAVPAAVTLGAGLQTTVSMPYSVGAPGTGTLTLTASGTYTSDAGSYSVPIVSYGVSVTPDGGAAPNRTPNTGGYSETFTVTNSGSVPNTFSFTCAGAGGVTCGAAPAAVTVGAGLPTTVSMPYSVGAAGTGTLTLTASGSSGGVSDQGSFSVPIVSYGVSVVPSITTGITPTRFENTGPHNESFVITNTGSAVNTYTFPCSGGGGVSCGTVPAPVSLAPNNTATVSMPYNVGSAGTGTLTLTANGTNTSGSGSYSVPIAKILSSVSMQNGFTPDALFIVEATANLYDGFGRVREVADARGYLARYDYGASNNGPFPTKLTRVRDGSNDLVTEISYEPNGYGYVSSIKNEAGTFRYFSYDGFGRLRQIQNNSHTPIKAYLYEYSRNAANGWIYQPATPNAVTDSTYLQQSPLKAVVSTAYIDGLGRPIQTVVRDGADYHVTVTQYDLMGRTWRVWNPYRRQTAGYHAAFATAATDSAVNYHGMADAKPYVETQYRPDPLGRVSRMIPQYFGPSPTFWKATSYGVEPTNKRLIVEAADELGKRTQDSSDVFGNVVRRVLGVGTINAITAFTYNVVGQRTQSTDPRGLVTTYAVDTRGMQRSRTSPDAGTVNAKYDKGGNVRFTQDANQAAAGTVYFTNYDFANRPLVSGLGALGAAIFGDLNADAAQAFENPNANWLVVRKYDSKPTTGPSDFPWNRFADQIAWNRFVDPTNPPVLNLTNVSGRLAAVASKSNGAWQVTLFSYDSDGGIATRYTFTEANDGNSVLTAVNMRDSVLWNLSGAPVERRLTVGSSSFNQWYDYNDRGLMTNLSASTTSTKPAADVTDTYRPSGLPASYLFQGGTTVPIRYTIRQQTERIGDPSLTTPPYPFSALYTYNANGTLLETEFHSVGSIATAKRYKYWFGGTYLDDLNRLTGGDFTQWSGGTWNVTTNHDLGPITYDKAGNILTLQRRNETGAVIDNLSYTIPPSSNRLTALADGIDGSTESWDAEDASASAIVYDANGNLSKWAAAPYLIDTITYDHQNLPLSIRRAGPTTTNYRYDGSGQRITKQDGTGPTEVYLRDGSTTLAVFTMNGATATTWYFNLVWEDRVVGRQPNAPAPRNYYHFDILGSNRAVVQGSTVVESYDFEPWGLRMPGRTLAGPTKEGFTGKEQDAETGLDYFGARYYLPAVARWGAVDPMADKYPEWSTYNYVLDSPTGSIDKDGRQTSEVSRNPCAGGFGSGACSRAIFAGIGRRTEPLKRAEPVMMVIAASPLMPFAAMSAAPAIITVPADIAGGVLQDIATRPKEIAGVLSQRTQNSTTTAVGTAQNADGSTTTLVASSEGRLRPAQRAALRPGEVAVVGERGVHAEVNLLNAARRNGSTLTEVAASHGICPSCAQLLKDAGVVLRSALKKL